MADLNWFFSACAQTAGAIVAIVAGFLVTRLVSLSVERKGLAQSLARAERRLEAAEEVRTALQAEKQAREESAFRNAIIYDIVNSKGDFDLNLLLEQHYGYDLDREAMERIATEVSATAKQGFRDMAEFKDRDLADAEFEHVSLALGDRIAPQDREIYRSVFDNVRRMARNKVWTNIERLQHSPLDDLGASTLEGPIVAANEEADLHRRLRDASAEAMRAGLERNLLAEQLDRLAAANELLPAWFILAYLSAVGVGMPLALLPAGEKALGWRTPVLGLFLAGLTALVGYFGFVLHRITSRKDS